MPLFLPTKKWAGQDAFIIGGGPSLRGFDFSRLEGRNTIGCNQAFTHGVARCGCCFFSDYEWFKQNESALGAYASAGGIVVTHCHRLMQSGKLWLQSMRRMPNGVHKHALGFGGNSGIGAVNLALLFGAKRVFLLGFDCRNNEAGKTHWHDVYAHKPKQPYTRFLGGWETVAAHMPKIFPGREIINLTVGSAIPHFRIESPDTYLTRKETAA